ncbi:hypothetical protein ACT4MK_22330 [Bradyrhizobium barranii]|uniref:hypothetical protein n=1 Tax=Bradyrhizobium barranii TaxID=2992140 RepID=UPI00403320FF
MLTLLPSRNVLPIAAAALMIGDTLPAKAIDPVTAGKVAVIVSGAYENLRKWHNTQSGPGKPWRPGTPVQFINLSHQSVVFTAKGAVSCQISLKPTVTLPPGQEAYCNTGPENSSPFVVTYSVPNDPNAGTSAEANIGRGSVVAFYINTTVCASCVGMKVVSSEQDLSTLRDAFLYQH